MPRVTPGRSPCPPGLAAWILLPRRWSDRIVRPVQPGAARCRPAAGSGWWLAGAAAAFTIAELLAVPAHLGLSWDEAVYVSQVSGHAPAAYFDPARARGVPLLVAPVTLVTSSVAMLRGYLALASGLGLLGALWAWRPTRPAWVLALAGVAFGGLWVAQYYGPQAMPDEWVALSGLAAAGFFVRAAAAGAPAAQVFAAQRVLGSSAVPMVHPPRGTIRTDHETTSGGRRWTSLAGLASCLAVAALFRPGDAAYLAAALLLAVAAVPGWRRWPTAACVAGGFAAGAAEWVIEGYLRFGGPLHRLRLAGAEQGGLRPRLAMWDELRALNGPTLCRPCTIGWRYPVLSLWWLALPVLVTLGVLAARRAGRAGSSLLAAGCALALAAQYLFGIGYAAPRFLLPAYALLAIPVADGLAWLVTGAGPGLRRVAVPAAAVVLLAHLTAQQLVLAHEVRGTVLFHRDYLRIAADLRRLGVRPPCLIRGEQFIPVAYQAGCASAGRPRAALAAGQPVAVLAYRWQLPPGYARHWRRRQLSGTRVLRLAAYLPPARR